MSLIVNTNVRSLNAQGFLNRSNNGLSKAFERLSSGLRINSAADDAAGLAITDRMTAQIRGLTQAVRNSNDGISLSQTAESSMNEVTNTLQRMRELSVQAANDTNSTSDRQSIQAEVSQLIAEITRVGNNTQFNDMNILDGSVTDLVFHVGANSGQTIDLSLFDIRSSALGAYAQTSSTQDVDDQALAAGNLVINGVEIGASLAADDTKSTVNANSSAIAKAAAINRMLGQTDVEARVVATSYSGIAAVFGGNIAAGDIVINGVDIGALNGVAAGDTDGRLAAAINAKAAATGVTAEVDGGGRLVLTAVDGRNIDYDLSPNGADVSGLTLGPLHDTAFGGIQLTSASDLTVTGNASLARIGIANATYSVDFSRVVSTISVTTRQGANDALQIIDSAIDQISTRRGELGAVQNRLQSTVANLEQVTEQLSAARSRIRDADFAAETSEMTRNQILQQAGVSILSQANQSPQSVLSLLGQ